MMHDSSYVRPTMMQEDVLDADASEECHDQIKGTCYANAAVSLVRAALGRVFGRPVPPHLSLVRELIFHGPKLSDDGGSPARALSYLCGVYSLQHETLKSLDLAKFELRHRRPVLFSFFLTDSQWNSFESFYEHTPDGILQTLPEPLLDEEGDGHAVLLVRYANGVFRFKNSWAEKFGDRGYFSVSKDALRFFRTRKYFTAFYTEDDLSKTEKQVWNMLDSESRERWGRMSFRQRSAVMEKFAKVDIGAKIMKRHEEKVWDRLSFEKDVNALNVEALQLKQKQIDGLENEVELLNKMKENEKKSNEKEQLVSQALLKQAEEDNVFYKQLLGLSLVGIFAVGVSYACSNSQQNNRNGNKK